MGYPEAQYTIAEVLSGIKIQQVTGIPPKNITASVVSGNQEVYITFNPEDTIINSQVICTVGGVLIRIKQGSAPTSPTDGTFVGDFTGTELKAHVSDPVKVTGLINDVPYFVRIFTYSDHGVFNLNPANIYSVTPFNRYATVTFNPDGGTRTGGGQLIQTIEKGTNAVAPILQKTNSTFDGWDKPLTNITQSVTIKALWKDIPPTKIFGFRQNFLDKNPDTTITYLEDATGFTPMHTNSGTGTVTMGSWIDGVWEWLDKNLPYMVRKDGTVDYALDPNDYTKKKDGTPSDISNTSYQGGAFAWIPKLYMKETYSADGNSRDVFFAMHNKDPRTLNYKLVGFTDFNDQELDGLWIPMFYMDASGRTISGTVACSEQTADQEKTIINNWSARGVFLGGPIMHVLRDIQYMLYKSTNIQQKGGEGRPNKAAISAPTNAIVGGGRFYGTALASNQLNKAFHSNVLLSYDHDVIDPYTVVSNRRIFMSKNYKYSSIASGYFNTGKDWPDIPNSFYPSKLYYLGDGFGSFPDPMTSNGSSTTALCAVIGASLTGFFMTKRLQKSSGGSNNIAAIRANTSSTSTFWATGCALLLLPPPAYSPN